MNKEPKIVEIPNNCTHKNHREDFETCPDCGNKYDSEEWLKDMTVFGYGIISGKHDSGVAVSPCKKCKALSWVHICFHGIEYGNIFCKNSKVVEVAKRELNKRKMSALRNWAYGLCGKCELLEEGSIETSTHRQCICGYGNVEFQCSRYKPYKDIFK